MSDFNVYVIADTVNEKKYVGKTTQGVEKRWKDHRADSKKSAYHFHRAIRKYGADKFYHAGWIGLGERFQNSEALSAIEIGLIARLKTAEQECGYNMTIGGDGVVPTPENIAAIRAAQGAVGKIYGKIYGRQNVESGHLASICSSGGKVGGRKNVESGHVARMGTFESRSAGGKIGGRKNVESGHIQRLGTIYGKTQGRKAVESGQILLANWTRWHRQHLKRAASNPKCPLCKSTETPVANFQNAENGRG